VKPKYLIPWLKFIKDNKILFKTIIKRFKTLALFTSYNDVFGNIIKPVLQRLIPNETERSYILMFYVEGIIAIVKEWIKNDCEMDIEDISNIISNCVNR
ncbi:MAG: TetR family transcriptional regulator C-terminal domain-containing protein, partial [Bacilli bacterium]|nr:TetR family transcriptional regulator C-terminal domain-containing protein [Bacilli bacterium]